MKGLLLGNAPSSGSTLLSVMLNSHPDIICGPELNLFAHRFFWKLEGNPWQHAVTSFIRNKSQLKFPEICPFTLTVTMASLKWYGHDENSLLNIINRSNNASEFAAAFYATSLQKEDKTLWAEKSPPNLYSIPDFLEQNQKNQAIILVRHGLDVAVSLMNRGYSFREAAKIWALEATLSRQIYENNANRVFLLRYEDLVSHPRDELGKLCHFLNIKNESERMLSYHSSSSRVSSDPTIDETKGGAASRWRQSPRQALSSASCGQWKRSLKDRHLVYFTNLTINNKIRGIGEFFLPASATETMDYFDYRLEPSPPQDNKLLPEENALALPQGKFVDAFVDALCPVNESSSQKLIPKGWAKLQKLIGLKS